ncbi:hypothetical protein B0H14DRAFT_2569817 [Mycena olivaceomarginata]|nr:hypothetical protein B0H14DRAFT_2569817 [Mycena olivaceomarginata]
MHGLALYNYKKTTMGRDCGEAPMEPPIRLCLVRSPVPKHRGFTDKNYCVSVTVVFIPEGLPVCVTLSLTVIAHAMCSNSILCKSLMTVESLGAIDFIASQWDLNICTVSTLRC